MSLQKQIENLLDECKNFFKYPPGRIIIAHKITYLISQEKSGVIAVSKCECDCGHNAIMSCCNCINGEIMRELTKDELCEWAKELIKRDQEYLLFTRLPDGSILRRKE
jgi:hypothetical protein